MYIILGWFKVKIKWEFFYDVCVLYYMGFFLFCYFYIEKYWLCGYNLVNVISFNENLFKRKIV